MAARIAARYVSRRLSSGGKILREEVKAAENVYIKKIEQEKLEKLARKGPKPGEQSSAAPEATGSDGKSSGPASSASGGAWNKLVRFAEDAVAVAALTATEWWLFSDRKEPITEELKALGFYHPSFAYTQTDQEV